MARITRDYRCGGCDTVTEHWVNKEEEATLTCPNCGSPDMTSIIGAPQIDYIGMATDGKNSSDALGTTIDRWQKMREQKQRIEQRNLERHGTHD